MVAIGGRGEDEDEEIEGKGVMNEQVGWRDNMRENGVKQKQPGPMR